jgi:hypothetical protein
VALRRARISVAAVLLALLPAACGVPTRSGSTGSGAAAAAAGPVVATLTEQGVQVELRWSTGAGPAAVLAATFTPVRAGFHLYAVDLPPDGVQGVGRPTRVEVGGGLVATGPQAADRGVRPLRVAGLDVPVPVYPDGPVTVRVPVRLAAGRPALAWVSYAACSPLTCLPPVSHRPVRLAIPGSA